MHRILTPAALITGLFVAIPAQALDYRSLAEIAVLYDAPSQKSTPLFVIARQTPVEIVVTLDPWVKVRDASGGLAWIDKRALSDKRTLMVTAARAQIRQSPEAQAALVFEAARDVVLELLESPPATGWARVRHRDGQTGYIRTSQAWGL